MNLVLKNVQILDPRSAHHKRRMDIHLSQGIIKRIGKELRPRAATSVNAKGMSLSPGWYDIAVHSGAPGREHREDFDSLERTAKRGGYTGLAIWPDTQPLIQHASDIHFIRASSDRLRLLNIDCIASHIASTDERQLSEMHDLDHAGAVGYGRGDRSIDDDNTLLRALLYLSQIGKPLFHMPSYPRLIEGAQVHESVATTALGLRSMPAVEEILRVQRDVELAQYAEAKLAIHGISCQDALKRAKAYKRSHPYLSLGASVSNICFTDDDLKGFDTGLKVIPPLRSASDQRALHRAVSDGTIDYVFSNHQPKESELKDVEFGLSEFGAATLDICYAMLNTCLYDSLDDTRLVELLSINPRAIVSQAAPVIEEKSAVNLTLFDRRSKHTWSLSDAQSKSKNYPPIKKELKGLVHGSFLGQNFWLREA